MFPYKNIVLSLGALPSLLAATFGRLIAPIDVTALNDLTAR
jgi:hypothetical protein